MLRRVTTRLTDYPLPFACGLPEAAERSNSMSNSENDGELGTSQAGPISVAEVFREVVSLLEQYSPAWYSDAHRSRVQAALRILERS